MNVHKDDSALSQLRKNHYVGMQKWPQIFCIKYFFTAGLDISGILIIKTSSDTYYRIRANKRPAAYKKIGVLW